MKRKAAAMYFAVPLLKFLLLGSNILIYWEDNVDFFSPLVFHLGF